MRAFKPSWIFLPALWIYGVAIALATWLLDLLATPWVWFARRAAADTAPATRNASVIVLTWNGRHFLEALLPTLREALAHAPGDHEAIVVDNGSTDGTAEWCARTHPWARVVRVPENRFFIRGNREGTAAATRDVLVFLNNDMRVEPDFLRALLAPFGDPKLFATTARIEMDGDRVETGCTTARFVRGAFKLAHVPRDVPGPSLWAGGGASAFDRAKYAALGGFEDLYEPCYVEDVSLSYQAWKRGWHVRFVPESRVHHVRRGTSAKVFGHRQVEQLDARNRELFFWRSVTSPWLVLQHVLFLPWQALRNGRATGMPVQYRALLAAIPRLPQALLAREHGRVHARRSDRQVLAEGNP